MLIFTDANSWTSGKGERIGMKRGEGGEEGKEWKKKNEERGGRERRGCY